MPAAPPHADPPPAADSQVRRRGVSMDLLTDLYEHSLDQGYAEAAARRTAGHERPRAHPVLLAVGLLAVGLLLATAAVQARAQSGAVAEARAALTAEIEDRSAANDRLEGRLEQTREAVAARRRTDLELTTQGAALAERLGRLEVVTGTSAVSGPGLVLTLTDAPLDDLAPDGDPRTGTAVDGQVTDRDLQTVVNELWAAGAEAVAVNGQRLTALSAIRSAGAAVLVDFRPLVPPYRVRAVGPPRLPERLVSGFGGSYLEVLRDYGITYALEDRDTVRLPASAGVTLRHAAAADDVVSAPTPTSDVSGGSS